MCGLRCSIRRCRSLHSWSPGLPPVTEEPHSLLGVCRVLAPGRQEDADWRLFADLRGFTARFDGADPEQASLLLRQFYRCAEDVLFPEAIIDKLIGDEVMALYLPDMKRTIDLADVPMLMLEHARELLRSVGYGSGEAPFVEMGIGLDFGEAFVGTSPACPVRLHGGRRRRQHRLAPSEPGVRRRNRSFRTSRTETPELHWEPRAARTQR